MLPTGCPQDSQGSNMDQQDRGPDAKAPEDKAPAQRKGAVEDCANDSNWGVGSASALDNLRRHDFRVRRSKPADLDDDRPSSD